MDFSVIQRADLSAAEFAFLIRYKDAEENVRSMTRLSTYRWLTGKAAPNDKVAPRVKRVMSLIQDAIDAGDLPLKLGTPRADRKRLIAVAIGKQLNKPVD